MNKLKSSLPIAGLLLLMLSLTNGESAFYYLQPNYYPLHYYPYSFSPQSTANTPIKTADQVKEVASNNNNKPNERLFGFALSSLLGQQSRPAVPCPACPAAQITTCPPPVTIPPASIVVSSATSCATLLGASACTFASAAPSGTFTVTFPAATAGNAVVTVVPTPPNTKVQVICPTLPAGITATTQTGALAAATTRVDAGYSSVLVTGTPTGALPATAVCTWTSIP